MASQAKTHTYAMPARDTKSVNGSAAASISPRDGKKSSRDSRYAKRLNHNPRLRARAYHRNSTAPMPALATIKSR